MNSSHYIWSGFGFWNFFFCRICEIVVTLYILKKIVRLQIKVLKLLVRNPSRLKFIDMKPIRTPHNLEQPIISLMSYFYLPGIPNSFLARGPHFHFAQVPANYVTGPASQARSESCGIRFASFNTEFFDSEYCHYNSICFYDFFPVLQTLSKTFLSLFCL